MRQFDALAHSLAVPGNLAVGRVPQADLLDRLPGFVLRFPGPQAVDPQIPGHELQPRQPFGESIPLSAVTHQTKHRLGVGRTPAQHLNRPLRRLQEPGQDIHQSTLPRPVGTHQAGDTRRNFQIDTVDSQNFSIELGDVVKDNQILITRSAHRTIS